MSVSQHDGDRRLLQLILPARQAAAAADFLLAQSHTPFFTAIETQGFGQPHEQLDAVEQVEGAQHKIKFEIELMAADVAPLLTALREALPAANLYYRLLPVLASGEVEGGPRPGTGDPG